MKKPHRSCANPAIVSFEKQQATYNEASDRTWMCGGEQSEAVSGARPRSCETIQAKGRKPFAHL